MLLSKIEIVNYRNLQDVRLELAAKINCFVGLNGMGKTNLLDAVYLLSFTKSSLTNHDAECISHGEQLAMVKGTYLSNSSADTTTITCALRQGRKKQFRHDDKDYKRLIEHIGLIPLVLVSPADQELIAEGSEQRRRFMDSVISQYDRHYLEQLTLYQQLLRQRNAMLRRCADQPPTDSDNELFDIVEMQLAGAAQHIYNGRKLFLQQFEPYFNDIYQYISEKKETVSLKYISQLDDRDISTALRSTRSRDLILGWTSQGIHKDDLEMLIGGYPLKQVGSQGQQKTFVLALKLAQATFLAERDNDNGIWQTELERPILLLDDIFDKLDAERVARIVSIVCSSRFGQIFITDTDRQHIVDIVADYAEQSKIFEVSGGEVRPLR